jgi:tryptophanyl-tRNA synthetase
MMTPLGWLERVPTYKDQQEKLESKDLSTYGFLGYPLLQSADILIYRADKVPVGEDQVPHIEFSREVARRFNHLYGREPGFEDKAREAVKKLGSKRARSYTQLRTYFQQNGDKTAIERAHALLDEVPGLEHADRERLCGYLEGTGKMILVEPGALLTAASRMPGLDGQKMSKSYNNTFTLREDARVGDAQDPAHADRYGAGATHDPGDPDQVSGLAVAHQVYSDEACQAWVQQGCRSAGIGCLDCKQPVIDGILSRAGADARTRADRTWTTRAWCRISSPKVTTRRASSLARRCATCATRWA